MNHIYSWVTAQQNWKMQESKTLLRSEKDLQNKNSEKKLYLIRLAAPKILQLFFIDIFSLQALFCANLAICMLRACSAPTPWKILHFFQNVSQRVPRRHRLLRLHIKQMHVWKSYQNKSCSIFGAEYWIVVNINFYEILKSECSKSLFFF